MTQFTYFLEGNIDAEVLRQIVVDSADIGSLFDYIETLEATVMGHEGFSVKVNFTEDLSPEQETILANIISSYEYVAPIIDLTFPEYANSAAAIAGGLTPGQFFRTGERVKQVVPL